MKILQPYFVSKDIRGEIRGISQFDWMEEINYIESKSGTTRGGHYHKQTTELFFFIDGEIKIDIRNISTFKEDSLTVKKGDILLVEPMEVHTFHILKDAKWINVLSRRMDQKNPDFFYV